MSKDDAPYPVINRDDCPQKVIEWMDKRLKSSEISQANQLHDYHMEMLSVRQNVINHTMWLRMTGVALILLMILFLTSC